ncbi:hypothetical protein B7494_g3435 [Chlorociboria aeruginascens]|nr:hypothetical protein B7494_g3435 [Chlorociboria aeruginascens]
MDSFEAKSNMQPEFKPYSLQRDFGNSSSQPGVSFASMPSFESNKHTQSQYFPSSPSPLSSQLTSLSLQAPPCPSCKGQKYGFTAYFHNTKIFPEPPHELVGVVEQSYMLNNRLKSLIVNYILRDIEPGRVQEIEEELDGWGEEFDRLLWNVQLSAQGDFPFGRDAAGGLQAWKARLMRQLKDSIYGREKMAMSNGKMKDLVFELRKLWEGLWKDWKDSQMGRKSAMDEQYHAC